MYIYSDRGCYSESRSTRLRCGIRYVIYMDL